MCSINHDKKAIFIHIPKNGGTYIADILSKNYGFKNYYLQRPDHLLLCKYWDKSVKTHENKLIGTLLYYKTSKNLNKIMNMNEYKWKTYYIFAFVRNPYDRIVSGWNYINKYNINFHSFLKFGYKTNCWDYWHVFMSQYEHIKDFNGKINLNYIGKVETLEEDLKLILNNIGIKNIIHKPYKKNTKEHMNYKNYYINNEILEMVNFYIKNDLENLNFTKINNINDL
jgi:hypothetical protein